MPFQVLLLVIGTHVLLDIANSESACFEDQKLSNGQCIDCEFCLSGEGVDLEAKILVNEDGTPLECRPCKPCKPGYWNDPEYGQMACMKCRLNCFLMNRKEREPCGESSPGQCGACINSQYVDKDQNLDSPCTKPPATELVPKLKRQREAPTRAPYNHSSSLEDGLSIEWICLIISVVILAVIMCVAILRVYIKGCGRIRHTADPELAKGGSSKTTILSKASSSGGEINQPCKQDLSSDSDLETDGLISDEEARKKTNSNCSPHQELSLPAGPPSSGPECIHPIGEGYPVFQLFSGDKYIQYTSKHIYKEEKINPMFRELGVPEQKIYSEHDRYIHQKQEYNDMTTHLLQTWIQQAGRNATFDVLCNMLNKHEFQSVTQELLGLSNEPD